MIIIKKPNINDAPWKIFLSALFLSFIGLVALNSIFYQSQTLELNPFYKQLFFLILALIGFFNIFGTLGMGYLGTKYKKKNLLCILFK